MASCDVAKSNRLCRGDLTVTNPSLRVPVTESNRELLRFLRAAEQEAWEETMR